MIGVFATSDAGYQAEAVAAEVAAAWPQLSVTSSDGVVLPTLPFLGAGARPNWDDLLLVVFGAEGLPEQLHRPIRREIDAAAAERRPSRILPVSTLDGHRRPPVPLDTVYAMHCPTLVGNDVQRLTRRVGALLSLWLRGDDRKIFVSHRQADGRALATRISAYLNEHGYNAWRDEEQLAGGDIVQDEIERHVAGSNLVLLLDTPRAGESEWIAREVDAAIAGFVPLVPVLLRPDEATGRDAQPGIYATTELISHRITVELSADGIVEPLTDDQLDDMLAAVEDYLSRLLRHQRSLAANVEETFRSANFEWHPADIEHYLFVCAKEDDFGGPIRMLSYCSAVSPRYYLAVRALQNFKVGAPGTNRFNYRLFIYEPPLAQPELKRLARDHQFDQDSLLKLVDLGRLADFLSRH